MAKKINKAAVQEYAGLGLGAIVASKVSNVKLPVNLPAPVQAALPLILGVLIARRPGMIGSIGKGMIAAGIPKMVGALAPNLGINDNPGDGGTVSDYVIEGTDTFALAGAGDPSASNYALAGFDPVDQKDHNIQFG